MNKKQQTYLAIGIAIVVIAYFLVSGVFGF